MAKKEDIFRRIEGINPDALEIIDGFIENLRKFGDDCQGIVFITEDMSLDEIKMACLERNLKIGQTLDKAKEEAEREAMVIFEDLKKIKKGEELLPS